MKNKIMKIVGLLSVSGVLVCILATNPSSVHILQTLGKFGVGELPEFPKHLA